MKKTWLFFSGFSLLVCSCVLTGTANTSPDIQTKDNTAIPARIASAGMAQNISEKEKAEGWQPLFDGTTKKGWHVYNHKSDGSAWKVADGALYLDPAQLKDGQVFGGGDLLTDESFENFDFRAQWKISDSGNSGIMFYVQEDPKYEHAYYTGPELQVLDNGGHPDAKNIKHRAGDLYDLISSSPETVKGPGQWNQVELISNNGKLDFFLNDTKVVSTTLWDDNWKKLIAGSKFKSMPGFGIFHSGHLALQDHGFKVWFRNMMIKKL